MSTIYAIHDAGYQVLRVYDTFEKAEAAVLHDHDLRGEAATMYVAIVVAAFGEPVLYANWYAGGDDNDYGSKYWIYWLPTKGDAYRVPAEKARETMCAYFK